MLATELQHLFPGVPRTVGRLRQLAQLPGLEDGSVVTELMDRLGRYLEDRRVLGYRTLVVGLSGGADSAVACKLAHTATPDGAWAVTIDMGDETIEAARAVTTAIAMRHVVLDGRATYAAHLSVLPGSDVLSRVHLRSRLVTSLVHQFADNNNALVVDTTDRSERVLRLFEEGHRGHVAPLMDLYKSEVYAVAGAMNIPVPDERASGCPGLHNLDAFGLPWSMLDAVLHDLDVEGATAETISGDTGLDRLWLDRLERRVRQQPLRTDTVPFLLGDAGRETRHQIAEEEPW